jgi:hypothetical protein
VGKLHTKSLHRFAIITVAALWATETAASHFEFCWLTGSVESLEDDRSIQFLVTSSVPARKGSAESYDPEDCGRYVGTEIKVTLPSSLEVAKGVQLELIQRLWIDKDGQWWNAWEQTDGWEIHD